MSQTSYAVNMSAAFAGMLYDIDPTKDVMSYLANAAIPFGVCVKRVSGQDGQCDLPGSAGDDLVGVAIASMTKEVPLGGGTQTVGYAQFDSVPVLRHGRIYVAVEESVTPASSVFVRYASGAGGSQLGAFRASADTSTAVAWTKARFLSSASAGGIVVLEINI